MDASNTIFRCCEYKDIHNDMPVIKPILLGYKSWIELPMRLSIGYNLVEIHEVHPDIVELDWHGLACKCTGPWLHVRTSLLNTKPGMHIFKLSFVNTQTNNLSFTFFSYIIQEDNPDKSYLFDLDEKGDEDEFKSQTY